MDDDLGTAAERVSAFLWEAYGLTAWDAQRLKQMALALPEGQVGAYAIVGGRSLYLNFINLFLILLRFTGRRD